MFGTLRPGDHVKASRDITRGFMDAMYGTPSVRRGRRGIVREVQPGLWRTRYTVEFSQGWTSQTIPDIDASRLARTFAHGEAAWDRRRDISRGVKLGLLAMNIPVLVAIGLYLLRGGDPTTLAIEVVGSAITVILGLLLGHPILGVGLIIAWVALRRLRPTR